MKHIDKLFKEKLYNHEAVVPEGMWEKIAPIAEEESGRAILWFWFAGILTLLLGGYGIYKMVTTHTADPSNSNTLVQEIETADQSTDVFVNNHLTTHSNAQKENNTSQAEIAAPSSSDLKTNVVSVSETTKSTVSTPLIIDKQPSILIANQNNIAVKNSTVAITKKQSIGNTIEKITNVGGVPANLVITKSYINKEGSIIKQSNLADDTNIDGPIYDVIINTEAKDFNAGALLRIIEPLENIPLPAFQKKLKKKTTQSIL